MISPMACAPLPPSSSHISSFSSTLMYASPPKLQLMDLPTSSTTIIPSDDYRVQEDAINMSQCQRLVQKALNRNNYS